MAQPKVPDTMADGSRRAPALTAMLQAFAENAGIDQDFIDSSDHAYSCTCAKCAAWWKSMGADPDTGEWGPFGKNPPWLT